jgi:hypothetical protein
MQSGPPWSPLTQETCVGRGIGSTVWHLIAHHYDDREPLREDQTYPDSTHIPIAADDGRNKRRHDREGLLNERLFDATRKHFSKDKALLNVARSCLN